MSPSILTEGHSYSPLRQEDKRMLSEFPHAPKKTSRYNTSLIFYCFSLVVTFLATGLAAFLLGRLYPLQSLESKGQPFQEKNSPLDLNHSSYIFVSNQTFLQRPSAENDALWESLYPVDHGVFYWPDEAPLRTGFASFHQLHCVDALRKSWYADQDIKSALRNSEDTSHIEEFDVDHVLHCIEFLRQSIMCHADTNIQVERELNGGLLAFGEVYECKDWFQMVDWVNERNRRRKGLDVRRGEN